MTNPQGPGPGLFALGKSRHYMIRNGYSGDSAYSRSVVIVLLTGYKIGDFNRKPNRSTIGWACV